MSSEILRLCPAMSAPKSLPVSHWNMNLGSRAQRCGQVLQNFSAISSYWRAKKLYVGAHSLLVPARAVGGRDDDASLSRPDHLPDRAPQQQEQQRPNKEEWRVHHALVPNEKVTFAAHPTLDDGHAPQPGDDHRRQIQPDEGLDRRLPGVRSRIKDLVLVTVLTDRRTSLGSVSRIEPDDGAEWQADPNQVIRHKTPSIEDDVTNVGEGLRLESPPVGDGRNPGIDHRGNEGPDQAFDQQSDQTVAMPVSPALIHGKVGTSHSLSRYACSTRAP